MQVRDAITLQSLEKRGKNTELQETIPNSIHHATAPQTVAGSSQCHSFLFGQNLRTCVRCEMIGEKLQTVL